MSHRGDSKASRSNPPNESNDDESRERERTKRIREAAREHETDNDPASFERAFAAVARGAHKPKKQDSEKK